MLRRGLALLGTLAVLNVSGCGLVQLVTLPFQLIFSLLGLIGDGVGSLVDSIVLVEPISGPPPIVRSHEPGEFALGPVGPESRFRVVCSAPAHETVTYLWPDDFPESSRPDGGEVRVQCWLPRVTSSVAADTEADETP